MFLIRYNISTFLPVISNCNSLVMKAAYFVSFLDVITNAPDLKELPKSGQYFSHFVWK